MIAESRAAELESVIGRIVHENVLTTFEIDGCRALGAVELGIAAGDNPGRIRSEASFTMLRGPAQSRYSAARRADAGSTGMIIAEQARRCSIVTRRMCSDPRTVEYIARRASRRQKQARGDVVNEALHCEGGVQGFGAANRDVAR